MYRLRLNKFVICLIAAAVFFCGLADAFAQVRVKGYTRKDGTYVKPHYRSNPDGNFYNNWSTYGNVNPYTGRVGTRRRPPANYGADVYVNGYSRRDGTRVRSHYRSAPDGNFYNNWSTKGNTNPYTGERGTRVTPPDGYGGTAGSSSISSYSAVEAWSSPNDDYVYSQPDQTPRPRASEIRNRVYSSLSDEEKVEHLATSQSLADQGKRWTWGVYSPTQLQELSERVAAAKRIAEHGIELRWHSYTLPELLAIEKRLKANAQDRSRALATLPY